MPVRNPGVTSVAQTVPAFLSVSGSPVTTSGTLAISLSGTALPLANGGTGATTKAAAFDALQPMTTGGDIIYGGASGTGTRLANGSSGNVLMSAGSTNAPTWSTVPAFLAGAANSGFSAGTTIYLSLFGIDNGNGTESAVQVLAPCAGTLKNFYVRTVSSQPASGSLVLTLRKNASDQSITVTYAAGAAAATASDTTHSFTVAAGDLLTLKAVNNASGNSAIIYSWSVQLLP